MLLIFTEVTAAGQDLLGFTLFPKGSVEGDISPVAIKVSCIWPSPKWLQASRMSHWFIPGAGTTICSAKRLFVGAENVGIIVFVLSAQLTLWHCASKLEISLLSAPTLTAAHRLLGTCHRTELLADCVQEMGVAVLRRKLILSILFF